MLESTKSLKDNRFTLACTTGPYRCQFSLHPLVLFQQRLKAHIANSKTVSLLAGRSHPRKLEICMRRIICSDLDIKQSIEHATSFRGLNIIKPKLNLGRR